MRANIKHKNGHNSSPWGSPGVRIWLKSFYQIPKGFAMPKGGPKLVKINAVKHFWGGHKSA